MPIKAMLFDYIGAKGPAPLLYPYRDGPIKITSFRQR